MRTYPILIVAAVCVYGCLRQDAKQQNTNQNNLVVIGTVDSLFSGHINEYRKFWIYTPSSANDPTHEAIKYPVIYLLDGKAHFHSVSGMVHELSSVNKNTIIPQMIVVGVINTDRARDMVPTYDMPVGFADPETFYSGGGNNFIDFIEHELIPYIDSKYQTSSYRLFFGHSLSGLAVLHTLLTRPYLFNDYLVIDPSLVDNNGLEIQIADSILAYRRFDEKSLYVAVANDVDMEYDEIIKDSTWWTWTKRFIIDLIDVVEKSNENGLSFKWKFYENDNHSNVVLNAEYDALRSALSWYNFHEYNRIIQQEAGSDTAQYIELIKSHYREISSRLEYPVLPPEFMISMLFQKYNLIGEPELAYALINLNLENYPESPDALTDMGVFLLFQHKDTANAIKYFLRALDIDENNMAKDVLEVNNLI